MAGEKVDPSKVDASNTLNLDYEDLPKEHHQEFEDEVKWPNEEAKARLLSCYGKTRQGVIEKEKFVLPTLSSSTTSTDAPEITAPVSTTTSNVTLAQVENLFAE